MSDPAETTQEEAGQQAFAALLRARIPNFGLQRGALEDFARRCDPYGKLTGSQIGSYARGDFAPTVSTLRLLCRGMGIDLIDGFRVLVGIQPPDELPEPENLESLYNDINRIAQKMNQLIVKSTAQRHSPRRRRSPRTNGTSDEQSDVCAQYINLTIDSKSDYDHQGHYDENIRIIDQSLLATAS